MIESQVEDSVIITLAEKEIEFKKKMDIKK